MALLKRFSSFAGDALILGEERFVEWHDTAEWGDSANNKSSHILTIHNVGFDAVKKILNLLAEPEETEEEAADTEPDPAPIPEVPASPVSILQSKAAVANGEHKPATVREAAVAQVSPTATPLPLFGVPVLPTKDTKAKRAPMAEPAPTQALKNVLGSLCSEPKVTQDAPKPAVKNGAFGVSGDAWGLSGDGAGGTPEGAEEQSQDEAAPPSEPALEAAARRAATRAADLAAQAPPTGAPREVSPIVAEVLPEPTALTITIPNHMMHASALATVLKWLIKDHSITGIEEQITTCLALQGTGKIPVFNRYKPSELRAAVTRFSGASAPKPEEALG